MKLTKKDKASFNGIYNRFNSAIGSAEKQRIISDLPLEDLKKFSFHLFNEAYKYSEDLKLQDGHVPQNRLRITQDELKAVAPYLVCAKIKNIYESLGDNPTDAKIKTAIEQAFDIQKGDVEEDKLNELVNVIKELKESKLVNPGECIERVLEAPDFWEKYFLWLIHLFVQKTAREIRNENKRAEYQVEKETHMQNAYNTQYEALEQKKNIIGNNQINRVLELKQKKSVLRSHLIKTSENFENEKPHEKSSLSRPIHTVVTVTKKDKDAEYIMKKHTDNGVNEVIAAEFMRFFIPETPKYRSIDGKNEIISKKVGFNNVTNEYKTFAYQEQRKGLSIKENLDLAKQYYKIQIVSLLVGNCDMHDDNIMYGKDKNGKETLYPIDFDHALGRSNLLFTCNHPYWNIIVSRNRGIEGLEEAIYEVSKIWHEKKQEIKLHLKQVCKALGKTDDWYKERIEVIDKNKTFFSQEQVTIIQGNKFTLPPLIIGKYQMAEYEKRNNIGQGAELAI